jgi:hypothetical protein
VDLAFLQLMAFLPFTPRVPMVLAEETVDFGRVNDHILRRRHALEQAALPFVRRVALLTMDMGLVPVALTRDLEDTIWRGLRATARFGHRTVRQELHRLRQQRTVQAAYELPDAGLRGQVAAGGATAVDDHARQRARQAAERITEAANEAASQPGLSPAEREALIAEAARRAAHNVVLELVGETLNLGRAASALTMSNPPRFAFRSEQLDETMCAPCGVEHGGIFQIDSPEFFAHMPPAFCLGGGRCRGIMVYGDDPAQVTLRPAAR